MLASQQAIIRANTILTTLPRLTVQALYLVGGAVRDLMRGDTVIKDWDILIPHDAIAIARRFADTIGGAFVLLHEEQPTARVVQGGRQYDFIQFRGDTLEDDLRTRDFTINAIAVDLRSLLVGVTTPEIDPCGGIADLEARVLRPCGPDVFAADPLRAVRLYRFAATLGFIPTPEAEAQARAVAGQLESVAPERITDELARLFAVPGAAPAMGGLVRSGLWEAIVPETTVGRGMAQSENHHLDVFDHDTAAAVTVAEFLATLDDWAAPHADDFRAWLDMPTAGGRTRRWVLPLAALLHDAAKPVVRQVKSDGAPAFPRHEQAGGHLARQIAERMRLSRPERDLLVAAIRHHARPNDLQEHGPNHPLRLMAVLGDAAPAAIMVVLGDRATARGPNRPPEKVAADIAFLQGLLRDYFGRYAPLLASPPLVTGDDLIHDLGLRPGRQIGYLLLLLRRRQLTSELTNAADALAIARELTKAK